MKKDKLNPRYFFFSLGVLVTLITSVVSFLNLVFETLNKKFPDVLNSVYQYGYNTYDYEAMRSALATLIIVFPIFLALSYFWKKASESKLGKIDEIIHKWMIYIILFLATAVVMVDLVTLVKYFISGEITERFIYKVIVAFVTASIVGKYYIFELIKYKFFGFKNWGLVFSITSSVLVVLAIVFSFCIMGSPAKQRLLRLDTKRVTDLTDLQWQVVNYWQQKEKLPETLEDLKDPISGFSLPVEPEFGKGKVYEYNKLGDMKFELCADFALPIPKGWSEYSKPAPINFGGYAGIGMGGDADIVASYPYPGDGVNDSWDHEAGRTCFERTIDPEKYPPFKKQL